ncbi:MAG: hypothetical protein Q9168_002045 [Polycauliona sp. 1 TL-2023]
MLLARPNCALCVSRSYNSHVLLSALNHKPLPFLAPGLYSYSTQIKANTHEHSNPLPAQPSQTLNPPASTLPPPLSLPTSEPNLPATGKLKFYYQTGRAYLTFYKTGVKNLWQNYKLLRKVRLQIPSGQSAEQALRAGLLSRSDYHLIRRTKRDVSRIPIFGLILVICGEFTPLLVIFLGLSGAVPRTCHIPQQIDGARVKAEARRRESFREGTIASAGQMEKVDGLQNLPRPIMLHVARSLGLYASLWDRLGVAPTILLPRRIQAAAERIDVDDFAIEKGGGVKHLSEAELRLAAEERGLDVVGRPSSELGSVLDRWMAARKRASITDLLCRRPSAWPRM